MQLGFWFYAGICFCCSQAESGLRPVRLLLYAGRLLFMLGFFLVGLEVLCRFDNEQAFRLVVQTGWGFTGF